MKPGLAEEQNYSPLGAPGHAPVRTPGPAHGIDLHLRRNLPGLGRHGRPGPALVQHRGNGAAPGRDRQAHHAGQALCAAGRSGGMAHVQAACRAGQHHGRPAAGQMSRIEPDRERLPVYAQQLTLKPCVRVLQGHHRSLLQRLEQPCRPTLARNGHRTTRLGRRGSRQVSPGIIRSALSSDTRPLTASD